MKKRVCCLYRVSTEQQVDYDQNHQADIPMQRRACHKFADKMGWEIVFEEQEDGVSGYKVRAEKRDKIQKIKALALEKQFDILLVFMFDRLGRISDETPFVVEWFVRNGIEVWSTEEGEQKFESHVDKLLNYIRFWQANGESEKISIRTKAGLAHLVEDGHFKGGVAPYGYDLVKSGRFNKRKQEMSDLRVNVAEAKVVQIIFDKYTEEGMGAHRITSWLNGQGYRARTGKNWHSASIRGMLQNLTYTGVLRCGETRSNLMEDLQIISPEQFEKALEITKARSEASKEAPVVPFSNNDNSLVGGMVFCGHCGSRLILTTTGKYRKRKDGTVDKKRRTRYSCYGKINKQTECEGQTGYTMHILDGVVDNAICSIFDQINRTPQEEWEAPYKKELEAKKAHCLMSQINHEKEQEALKILKDEVVKSLNNESSYSIDVLSNLIAKSKQECERLEDLYLEAMREVGICERAFMGFNSTYQTLLQRGREYPDATVEEKRKTLHFLANRVEVFQDYNVKFDFKIKMLQPMNGLVFGK